MQACAKGPAASAWNRETTFLPEFVWGALDAEREEYYTLRRAFAIDDVVQQKLVREIVLMEASLLNKLSAH